MDRKTDPRTIDELETMGYSIQLGGNTSDLINAIYFDPRQVSPWRGSRNNWEDEGIGWKLYIN
ncbi:hypothetical protein CHT99_11530 [Sphingobacterium cellulitidis]|nr:hypothetical protein CHT99_11530 [Sphingobacterium cellulitidis]